MATFSFVILLALAGLCTSVPVPNEAEKAIATFSGQKGPTDLSWRAENDPVMGGKSVSTFEVSGGVGLWKGQVKVVPFLHAPGFCTCRTEGAELPDLSSYEGMHIAFSVMPGTQLKSFQLQMTSSVRSGPRMGEFQANFNLTGAKDEEIYVPFASFIEDWRGEKEGGAPSKAQLGAITQIGVGSSGVAGTFDLALKEISVYSGSPAPKPPGPPASAGVTLVSFGEKATTWRVTNDPVMGGLSHSTFRVDKENATGLFYGEVKIVPKLKAPGFCNAETTAPFLQKFADASEFDGIEIVLKSLGALTAFKSSWGAKGQTEFGSYKAGFNVTAGMPSEWQTVSIPWNSYTSKWSDFTGGCHDHGAVCCTPQTPEVCPTKKAISAIASIGIWGEGTAGQFSLVIKSIRAVKL